MKSVLVKIVIALVVLAGLGFLFARSVRSTRSAPYSVDRDSLRGWTVSIEKAPTSIGALLVLRTSGGLAAGLSKQVFHRSMESQHSPDVATIPLVLQSEYDLSFSGHVSPEALADAARAAGLETASFEPRCLAYRRISEPGFTRQLYFVLFDATAFTGFRERAAALLKGATPGVAFDPAALSPVLLVSATDSAWDRWLPIHGDPQADCVAPIAVN